MKNWTQSDLRAHLFKTRQGKSFNQWLHWLQVNRITMWAESGLSEKDFGDAVNAASMDIFNALKDLRFPVDGENPLQVQLSPVPPQLEMRTLY